MRNSFGFGKEKEDKDAVQGELTSNGQGMVVYLDLSRPSRESSTGLTRTICAGKTVLPTGAEVRVQVYLPTEQGQEMRERRKRERLAERMAKKKNIWA